MSTHTEDVSIWTHSSTSEPRLSLRSTNLHFNCRIPWAVGLHKSEPVRQVECDYSQRLYKSHLSSWARSWCYYNLYPSVGGGNTLLSESIGSASISSNPAPTVGFFSGRFVILVQYLLYYNDILSLNIDYYYRLFSFVEKQNTPSPTTTKRHSCESPWIPQPYRIQLHGSWSYSFRIVINSSITVHTNLTGTDAIRRTRELPS